jgi:hypothetical protein
MLELTIYGNGQGNFILGVTNSTIKYKVEKGEIINSNPLNQERIIFYLKGKLDKSEINSENMSMKPIVDYYPVVVGHNNESQCTLEKILEINEKVA